MSMPTTDDLAAAGLRLSIEGPVATVTLHRPERRNAQTPTMWRALARLGAALPDDVWVVVVKGTGDSFSAGLDRAVLDGTGAAPGERSMPELLAAYDDEQMIAEIDDYQQGFVWLQRDDLLTVAAVQGHAVGAGFQLALQCDLRVVADDVRFCMKETALGLVPDLAGTKPLVAAVGYARALEICATARVVAAPEAVATGLAALSVPRDELDATVDDLVAAVVANPRAAVLGTKALLQTAADHDLDTQRLAERTEQVRRFRDLLGAGDRA